MLYCKLWTILECCYNAFIAKCSSYTISHFQLFRKESEIMAINHAKFWLFSCHCWCQRFFLLLYSQFCCEIRLIKKNLIKYFMRVLLFTLRQVILISSFGDVILLWCGDNFSNIIFIQPLDVSWPHRTI